MGVGYNSQPLPQSLIDQTRKNLLMSPDQGTGLVTHNLQAIQAQLPIMQGLLQGATNGYVNYNNNYYTTDQFKSLINQMQAYTLQDQNQLQTNGVTAPGTAPITATPATQLPSMPGTPINPVIAPNTSITSPSATPSAPSTVTNPAGGVNTTAGPSTAPQDEASILAEAELQKQLSGQTLQSQYNANQGYLSDLSALLQKQQAQSMSESLPGTYEDLNSRGLLRSSELGNRLALQAKNLSAETSNALAQRGLDYQGQYTQGLGNIETTYESMRNQALQRGLSLEDYASQLAASKELGFALQPQQPSNSKSNTGATMTGIGGLLTGASNVASIGK